MCEELCNQADSGEMQSCQDCGRLICFDVEHGDDIMRPARVTESGDVYCDWCARQHDDAEDAECDEPWEEELALEDVPVPGSGRCRECGCTAEDCRQCIAKTGAPCYWVEPDLCSACVGTNVAKEQP